MTAATPAASGPGAPGEPPSGGEPRKGGFFSGRRRLWAIVAGAAAFLLLGSGAVFAGVATASTPTAAEPEPTETQEPPRELPEVIDPAARLRTCSVAKYARDGRLRRLYAHVINAETGEVLFDRRGDSPARTASVLKIFTAAAAIEVLGADYRITTTVRTGSAPGSIVLIGRGDATLSALPAGQESVYKGAPKIDDLAAQTLASYSGPPISSIVLDATYWSPADKWDSTWETSERTQGYHSEVTALQVDGDRQNPRQQDSPRGTDPIAKAGQAFLASLRAQDTEGKVADEVSFSSGAAVGGTKLADVKSRPVGELVKYMLRVSDNTLAEMLARITSKESALDGSASSLQAAIPSALSRFDVPGGDLVIRDGSGLSHKNQVPASAMVALLKAMHDGDPVLDVVEKALPVAGESGTLANRFTGDAEGARGHVVAKTGWIKSAYTLAGLIDARDGTPIAFSLYAIRDGISSDARQALDSLTAAIYRCGDNLSNN